MIWQNVVMPEGMNIGNRLWGKRSWLQNRLTVWSWMNYLTVHTNYSRLEGADHPKYKRRRWSLSIPCPSCLLGSCHQLAGWSQSSTLLKFYFAQDNQPNFDCQSTVSATDPITGKPRTLHVDSQGFISFSGQYCAGCVFRNSGHFFTEPMAYGPTIRTEEADADSLRNGGKPDPCFPPWEWAVVQVSKFCLLFKWGWFGF